MITSDPETRRIIVITDDETSQHISQVISNLDRPKPQVLIKVVFLEVTYRNGSDIGFEGGIKKGIGGNTVTASNLFGLTQQGITPTTAATTLSGAGLYQVIGSDFMGTLRAIAEAGKVEVLSRPAILARNNQQASIVVGQQVPLINGTTFDTFGNQHNSFVYQNVGIILLVTPFITSDGMVEMILAPQISSIDPNQSVQISGGGTNSSAVNAPIIDIRSANTVVVTPDGQTVIIGGLMQNSKSTTDSKVPILGDIPLLGNLFKHKIKSDSKTELLIFLTPHVVQTPQQLAGLTGNESRKSELGSKAFSEKELNQFLEGGAPMPHAPPAKILPAKTTTSGSPHNRE